MPFHELVKNNYGIDRNIDLLTQENLLLHTKKLPKATDRVASFVRSQQLLVDDLLALEHQRCLEIQECVLDNQVIRITIKPPGNSWRRIIHKYSSFRFLFDRHHETKRQKNFVAYYYPPMKPRQST
ncbi:hypothetical protein PHYBLDRAFT_149979 [Phycomyces blakesleeanus NRRL 1555(-)]|uniref:Uncharacterized protein n=1 Tax=Phycomyces blakesleeanus (strain ATCC 8743b / DSM 1359 / FGSC 10004 / NBRC 33097 / NRRL 1555) TaxID=763407 RepID=A0A162ZTT3_PHYB8|nr:hypothetical protein PHYBLDRAFT_149979 [Phycomyces blakesleeanus NRRL 1555(-)]OAD68981.1 hypothetical protein PHYBLDRAFT_149979 [Phycomyces blakesleeanus NRRL 1555(-)]|eukprot:XP_018287021.1 hypothetical protein PHYBLDRAFT_149979 [Phycomyces blakesleeanus NRRL 1555(-)]